MSDAAKSWGSSPLLRDPKSPSRGAARAGGRCASEPDSTPYLHFPVKYADLSPDQQSRAILGLCGYGGDDAPPSVVGGAAVPHEPRVTVGAAGVYDTPVVVLDFASLCLVDAMMLHATVTSSLFSSMHPDATCRP